MRQAAKNHRDGVVPRGRGAGGDGGGSASAGSAEEQRETVQKEW